MEKKIGEKNKDRRNGFDRKRKRKSKFRSLLFLYKM